MTSPYAHHENHRLEQLRINRNTERLELAKIKRRQKATTDSTYGKTTVELAGWHQVQLDQAHLDIAKAETAYRAACDLAGENPID